MGSRRWLPSRRREAAWARWREHLAAQTRSGQTQVAYCRSQGLDPTQFSTWKRKLAGDTGKAPEADRPSTSAVEFLPLVIKRTQATDTPDMSSSPEKSEPMTIRVILRNGISVVMQIPGASGLARLLSDLAQVPC
jgi:hypothetical protein